MKRIYSISGLLLLFTFFSTVVLAQNATVKGKVTDAKTGEALIGVTVAVKGTSTGAQTDVNGAYTVNAPSNATLQVSYIGYTTQEVAVAGQTSIDFKLQSSTNELQGVVVVGYGTQRKVDVTGSIATVKGADVAKQASQNAVSGLQGKVAGVQIVNNGTPGSTPDITIRGLGTIYGNTKPLFVVDGVWYDDINFLNPQDIESFSVLKDASSTAIYGIRAANGVVLISTKRGAKGKPVINYNGFAGVQAVTNQVKMANATQYATAVNELAALNNGAAVFADPASYGTGTDWYKQILRKAFITNHQASISGGTDKYTYNYSFGYLNQDGIVKTNNFQRYTVHLSNDFKISKALKLGYTASGLSDKSRDVSGDIFHQLYGAAPTLPVRKADGSYGDPNDYGTGDGNNYNPQATLDFYNQRTKNKRVTYNVYGEVTFLKNFKFKSSFGGDVSQNEIRSYTPEYQATVKQFSNKTNLSLTHTDVRNWIWENTLSYEVKLNDHRITALLGYSALENVTRQINGQADNVPYAAKGNLQTSFPDDANVTYLATPGDQIRNRALSQFGRVNYSYKDKYLLNASIRRDGASQFFGANTYGYFPSVGAGWVITNEDFMKDQKVFSNLKLRGSWGKVGNSVVPINPTVQVIATDPYLTAIFGNPQVAYPGASINSIVPPSIVWEKTVSSDFGIEGGLFDNKLTFEADYYNRETQDAIFAIPVAGSLGTSNSALIGNQASIQNRGFEFLVGWKDQASNKFSYSISANLGINTNKVLNVITGKNPIYQGGDGIANGALATRTVVGEPIGQFYGYKVVGVFQTADQVSKSAQIGAKPGDFIYQDTNNDKIVDSRDRVALGSPLPKYSYGVNTSFTYKNFDLALDFQGVADVSVYNANVAYRFGNENFTQDFYNNRWHGEGTSNTYPSVNVGKTTNAAPNSFYVESGSYLRLRNAQLGYVLPRSLLNTWKISRVRLFANAQNALNIFGYKGFSPEIGGGVGSRGIDANVYPLYATYNFGVNVTF
ncbi:SusC/RagA family TonB-linked outer membrane protein [Mucilaginibacter phyllosphaerae]|uniref:TonB-dependent receptor n=1 Tax=Mucilaginibacter phyllosphaerae TaxID=1812349 RepID=A0A4Y8AF29_9SPHI|nr:TonB-dependent receptor [Mucilaginibacter phyllosphaerae]MBB3969007.1 TonB-linked SusC/RagA family outer membrane protein [Mucilaginibacter phyllosphaerae]TEW67374.1 TonB-dependent receptor [Mucilaginibacter phyllosphaerae]GGH22981.1 SusC/RagA family TonB-linked outer membrane protein [Mucilaginibacter phyllosphaerae]